MLEFENKHFVVRAENFIVGNDGKKLHFDFSYDKKTTYATKFQMKKFMKRKVMSIFYRAIEQEDERKRSGNS